LLLCRCYVTSPPPVYLTRAPCCWTPSFDIATTCGHSTCVFALCTPCLTVCVHSWVSQAQLKAAQASNAQLQAEVARLKRLLQEEQDHHASTPHACSPSTSPRPRGASFSSSSASASSPAVTATVRAAPKPVSAALTRSSMRPTSPTRVRHAQQALGAGGASAGANGACNGAQQESMSVVRGGTALEPRRRRLQAKSMSARTLRPTGLVHGAARAAARTDAGAIGGGNGRSPRSALA